ncbi:MAG: hypothetical protein HC945_01665 [Nitrosarchaeum sp.]|nr:hypothetical protein [Nitrosarchaeum sp.]
MNRKASAHTWSFLMFLIGTCVILGTWFFWFLYFFAAIALTIPEGWLVAALCIAAGNILLRLFAYELHTHSMNKQAYFAQALIANRFSSAFGWHLLLSVLDILFLIMLLLTTEMSAGTRLASGILALIRIPLFVHILHVEKTTPLAAAPKPRMTSPAARDDVRTLELSAKRTLEQIQEDLRRQQEELDKAEEETPPCDHGQNRKNTRTGQDKNHRKQPKKKASTPRKAAYHQNASKPQQHSQSPKNSSARHKPRQTPQGARRQYPKIPGDPRRKPKNPPGPSKKPPKQDPKHAAANNP